jgi:hypothetical protein
MGPEALDSRVPWIRSDVEAAVRSRDEARIWDLQSGKVSDRARQGGLDEAFIYKMPDMGGVCAVCARTII